MYLPAAEVKPAEPPPAIPLAPPEGNGEHILVVDDEQGVLAMTRAALENYGYKVSTAANGLEAISLFRENAKAIQLVITDHNLPVLGARAMITALRKIQPAVRVILTSGGENGTDEDVEARGNGFSPNLSRLKRCSKWPTTSLQPRRTPKCARGRPRQTAPVWGKVAPHRANPTPETERRSSP